MDSREQVAATSSVIHAVTAGLNAEGYGTFMARKYHDVPAHRWAGSAA